jgi:hypothetical protein
MKILTVVLALCLCFGCATTHQPEPKKKPTAGKVTSSSRKKTTKVRTDEEVKAYPVGRYSDPDLPGVMHERHTIYRVEQSPDWNYMPDAPYALPLGPTVARSNPSASYYVKTDSELMNAQQKAHNEALLEQNRALKKRIESLEQNESKNQQEIDRLKKEMESLPAPQSAAPVEPASPEPESQPWTEFSD